MNTIGSLQALLISQDSSVSIVTWLQDGWLRKCLILCRDKRLFFSPKHPDWPGTHPAYSIGTGGSVPGHCPSWHAHRQSFFFYLLPALSFAMSSSTWLNCTVLSHSTHAIPLSFNSNVLNICVQPIIFTWPKYRSSLSPNSQIVNSTFSKISLSTCQVRTDLVGTPI